TAGGNGGGLFASGGTVTVTNSRFTGNTATNGGGIEDRAATLALSFSEVDNNRAVSNANAEGGFGGGLDASTGVTAVTVANSLFLNDSADAGGGAIFQGVGTLTVNSSQFTGNSGGDAGALGFQGATLTVTGSTFTGNQ